MIRHIILDKAAPADTIEAEALKTYEAAMRKVVSIAPAEKGDAFGSRVLARRTKFLKRVNMKDTPYCAVRLPEKPKPVRYPAQPTYAPARAPALGSDTDFLAAPPERDAE